MNYQIIFLKYHPSHFHILQRYKLNQFSFISIESTFFYNDFHNQLMQILSSKYSEAPLNQNLNQLNSSLYPPTNYKTLLSPLKRKLLSFAKINRLILMFSIG